MESVNLLAVLNCRQLVTLAGPDRPRIRDEMRELSIIENGSMLIRDGIIEDVGNQRDIEQLLFDEVAVVDAQRGVVLPGFVDAHTHAVFAGTRVDDFERRIAGETYEDIAQAGGGIVSTVEKTRAAVEDDLLEISRRYADWFTRCGTTTVEAKSGYGLDTETELKMLRVIKELGFVPTFLGAHTVPPEFAGNSDAYVDLVINEMLVDVLDLAEYCDVFCERTAFSIQQSRAILTRARELGLGLRVHADQLSRNGGAELAAELRTVTADHLEQVDEHGIDALARAHVQPVLLPASVYSLGLNRFAPARQMIDAGLAIVLATDFNPGSSPTPSMPFVLSLACTQMRMLPAEAITAATINAAYSLGRGGETGSLQPGKRADFVIWDCDDYREIPYFTGIELASSVYIDGDAAYARLGAT